MSGLRDHYVSEIHKLINSIMGKEVSIGHFSSDSIYDEISKSYSISFSISYASVKDRVIPFRIYDNGREEVFSHDFFVEAQAIIYMRELVSTPNSDISNISIEVSKGDMDCEYYSLRCRFIRKVQHADKTDEHSQSSSKCADFARETVDRAMVSEEKKKSRLESEHSAKMYAPDYVAVSVDNRKQDNKLMITLGIDLKEASGGDQLLEEYIAGFVPPIFSSMSDIFVLLARKNYAYGANSINSVGEMGLAVYANSKTNRILTLIKANDDSRNKESRKDSWDDLLGYSIIARAFRTGAWGHAIKIATDNVDKHKTYGDKN